MIKEYLLKAEVGRFGSIQYIFMCAGYLSVFYLKYDWTRTYWWLVILFPALFEAVRLGLFCKLFFFDSPVSRFNRSLKAKELLSDVLEREMPEVVSWDSLFAVCL